jgi:CheY-like chemotaxis protein
MLVVDDNRANLLFLKLALEKLGMACDEAKNGQIALDMTAQSIYDLILMDCQMPVTDGYAAAASIRSLPSPNGMAPIIALSANASADDEAKCLLAGMNGYLAKPVMLKELLDLIGHVAGSQHENPEKPDHYRASVQSLIREMRFTEKEAHKLLFEFLRAAPEVLQKIEQALAEGRFSDVSALAHQLKGVSGNLRLHALHAASIRLENALKQNSGVVEAVDVMRAITTAYLKGAADAGQELTDD